MSMQVPMNVDYADIRAVVVRCGCGDPDSHAPQGQPCPSPRVLEDRGIVAVYRRPGLLKRALSSITRRS